MIFVRDLTTDEHKELKRMTRQEIGRVAQRAQIILLSANRRTVPEIARIFDLRRATVRFWIERFNREGPVGLYDEPRSGRPRKATPEVEQTIVAGRQEQGEVEAALRTLKAANPAPSRDVPLGF